MSLLQQIIDIKDAKNITNKELALRTGYKKEFISRFVNGKVNNPTIKTVLDIIDALEIELKLTNTI